MPIQFSCPHCGKQTTVADQYAGRTGPCAACGNPITIPGEISESSERRAAPVPDSARSSASSSGCAVAMIVAVVLLAFLACAGGVALLLYPAMGTSLGNARGAAYRAECRNNLRQIALAMHNYHDTYGSLPPAYVEDEEGNPLYSWRVLILPFMEQSALYDQFDLSEAWDSPRNLALSSMSLACYQCPAATGNQPAETNYMVVVGPSTAFPGAEPMSFADILDGTSNTIMVAEVVGTGVSWAEPTDLDVAKIAFPLSNGATTTPSSEHAGGIQVAMCDGSSHFFVNQISPQEFNAMLTRDGAEVVTLGN